MSLRNKLKLKFSLVILLALVAGVISYPRAVAKIPPIYNTVNTLKIKLGLDLQGGFHLEYKADLSKVDASKRAEALSSLQSAIERRVNKFGVSEPLVYIKKSGTDEILVVELAGVKDINEAKKNISGTPLLEFKEEQIDTSNQIPQETLDQMNVQAKAKAEDLLKQALVPGSDFSQLAKDNSQDHAAKDNGGDLGIIKKGASAPELNDALFDPDPNFKDGSVYPKLVETESGWLIIKKITTTGSGDAEEIHAAGIIIAKYREPAPKTNYIETGLTGKNLKKASVDYTNQALSEPTVSLQFDTEGAKLLADISKRNIGKPLAIFLDGLPIVDGNGDGVINELDPPYDPIIQAELTNGQAEISGSLTIDKAKELVARLNEGSLPVPIGDPIYQQSVEASLGQASLTTSLKAGAVGLAIVLIFMIIYYRYLGLVASLALIIYTALMISIFKISPLTPWGITFTLSGIAGFILSIGMAVDANVLIFERIKEELRRDRRLPSAVDEGFKRAWPSIRDGNYSTILTSLILVWVGTGFVKGFAIILMVGVVMSMFTAIVIVKIMLKFTLGEWAEKYPWLIARTRKNNEISPKK